MNEGLKRYLDALPIEELFDLAEFVCDLDRAGMSVMTADGQPLARELSEYTNSAYIELSEFAGAAA